MRQNSRSKWLTFFRLRRISRLNSEILGPPRTPPFEKDADKKPSETQVEERRRELGD